MRLFLRKLGLVCLMAVFLSLIVGSLLLALRAMWTQNVWIALPLLLWLPSIALLMTLDKPKEI